MASSGPHPVGSNSVDPMDKILDAMAAAGPSSGKKEVTYEDFQKMMDSTPLFMRETPADDDDNPVLQGLRTLMMDGEGDGERQPSG